MTIQLVTPREQELEREVAALKRNIDFAYMEGFEAAKHEARDAYNAEIDALKAELETANHLLSMRLTNSGSDAVIAALRAKLAETEKDYERFRTEYNEKMHEKQMIIFDYEMADYKGEAESLRGWKDAVEHEVTVTCCGPDDWNDPRKMVKHIIDWNVAVALDPAVSFDAQNLIERGMAELKAKLAEYEKRFTAFNWNEAAGCWENGTIVGEGTCNPHPDAPHGFDRNGSHNAGCYVCECESWSPGDAS